jgi:hypothetical protein
MKEDAELESTSIEQEQRLQELRAQQIRAEDLFRGYRVELAHDFDDEDV